MDIDRLERERSVTRLPVSQGRANSIVLSDGDHLRGEVVRRARSNEHFHFVRGSWWHDEERRLARGSDREGHLDLQGTTPEE